MNCFLRIVIALQKGVVRLSNNLTLMGGIACIWSNKTEYNLARKVVF